ncbi:Ubiquitin carboxyl-terminal hydrolase 27 [Sesbania bispinosa]|nr:Ubiquitin carboxyl-terminal hydrolase 27 [Sesbania bispinosa]
MLVMSHYIPNFNLTSQHDVAEAFLHLEVVMNLDGCDAQKMSSLADTSAFNNIILTSVQRDCKVKVVHPRLP